MTEKAAVDKLTNGAVGIILLLQPLLLLSVRNGMSVCFVLLVVVSFCYLIQRVIHWSRPDIFFALSMASPMVATLISQAFHRSFHLASLDSPSRFFFAIPMYLMLRDFPLSVARAIEYGFPLGTFAALLTSIFYPSIYWQVQGTYFVDPAQFGGATLILGCLSVGTINWTRHDPVPVVVLKASALIVGIYCGVHSSERGVWMAIPVLAIILIRHRISVKYGTLVAALAIIALGLASYWLSPEIHDRMAVTQNEIAKIASGDLETSAGFRLQMWNAGIELVRENPIAGVGPDGVSDALRSLARRGWMTPSALQAALSQLHNEILANTVRLGLLGLVSILAVYLVPAILFVNAAASADRFVQRAAHLGVLFVFGYLVLGLTIETFNIKMFASFYAGTIAMLVGAVRHTSSPLAGAK